MSVLESRIESQFLTWCISVGILCKKLVLASGSGWPDRTLFYKGHCMFIELKRKGERPRPLQLYTLETLTKAGFNAVWADNLETAIQLCNDWRKDVDAIS